MFSTFNNYTLFIKLSSFLPSHFLISKALPISYWTDNFYKRKQTTERITLIADW
uniref:Uncharacterized protein n=1 Tax=Anguilla anguilla TaxID=7936 RepID=A0A0E9WXI4_ANGAN